MSDKKVLQAGAIIIACGLLLRLTINLWAPVVQAAEPVTLGQVIVFLQTGRVVRYRAPVQKPSVPADEPQKPITKALFSQSDQTLVQLRNTSDKSADVSAALLDTLQWDLYAAQPAVLILHSHGTESYQNTEGYEESAAYRTLDTDYNMISVGDLLAQELEKAGIRVIHDRTLYDAHSYNDAYINAREAIQAHLAENPSICLVLDLHRDSIEDEAGNQVAQTVFSQGATVAPLMLVVGTDYGGLHHPRWQENLSLALKLQLQLEDICPGICRNINLRTQRFNQDLSPGAMLVEVGASGNTRQEALRAAEILAQGILSLAHGSLS